MFKLNATKLADQEQIPNITMVEYDVEVNTESDDAKQECLKVVKKSAIVFTSFFAPMQRNDTAYDKANEEYNQMHEFTGRSAVKEVSYSTIFFYDAKYGRLLQKIVGGWIFLALNDTKIWFMTRQKVGIIRWGALEQDDHIPFLQDDELEQTLEKEFLFDYGKSSTTLDSLQDSPESRLCEAYLHQGRNRVSVLFNNLCVITFQLKEA